MEHKEKKISPAMKITKKLATKLHKGTRKKICVICVICGFLFLYVSGRRRAVMNDWHLFIVGEQIDGSFSMSDQLFRDI